MYKSVMKTDDSIGAFFEDDGETGYFYLFDPKAPNGEKILSAIQIYSRRPNITSNDVELFLDKEETKIALSIRKQIMGVFDTIHSINYSSCQQEGVVSPIPIEVLNAFTLQDAKDK